LVDDLVFLFTNRIIFFTELDVILDKWDLIGKPVTAPEPEFATKEDIKKQAEKIDQFIEISNKRHEDVLASQAHIRNTLAQILAKLS